MLAVSCKVKACGYCWGAQGKGNVVTPGCDGGDIPGGRLWVWMKGTCWHGGDGPGRYFGFCCILTRHSKPVHSRGHCTVETTA